MVGYSFWTPENGIPVNTGRLRSLDRVEGRGGEKAIKDASGGGILKQEGPFYAWSEAKDTALMLNAKYIVKTTSDSYYVKCFEHRKNTRQIPSSMELYKQVVACACDTGESRVWILEYH